MHKILVPLDGSTRAAAAASVAAAFAQALGSELLLIQVVAPETPATSQETAQDRPVTQAAAHRYLEQVAAQIRRPDLSVTVTTDFGYPTTRIVETIHRDPFITRIVLSTHGAGEALERVFGHTAEEILSTAGVPVLLVRSGQTLPRLTAGSIILVPFDNSASAHQALNEAESIAAKVGARLLIVSVLPPLAGQGRQGGAPARFIEAGQSEANQTTRELEQIVRRIAATGLPVQMELARGQPAEEITRLAAAAGAALIVMAAYGESALHWGKVALAVLRQTPVPILLSAAPQAHWYNSGDEQSARRIYQPISVLAP